MNELIEEYAIRQDKYFKNTQWPDKEGLKDGLRQFRKAILAEAREIARARVDAIEGLLACYRLGKHPTEKLHGQLAKSKAAFDQMMEEE